jgi:tRNA A-37 threonylcarbamoyl transferase component Bud32
VPDSIPLMADRVLLGRYRMVRPIARGGMAEVWEGYDDVLARPVAVKVLHPHLAADAAFVERFRREAVAAAKLAHPGIVATFDTGTDGDVVFIVMELVRGRTLRDAMEETGPLPPSMAVTIAAGVADALDHAHRAGLVHRDVKPANILLPDHDGSTGPVLRVKVADFGIAKLQSAPGSGDLTQTGAIVGTAKYLSPEQVQGDPPDARSDEYALGVMLYEMLCGQPPYAAETELATALQHVGGEPLGPCQLDPAIPRPLEATVLRAMARDREARYPSLAHFRSALLALDLVDTGLIETTDVGDDAVPSVVRDPTPPAGTKPRARPRRRRVAPVAFVTGILVIALVAVAVLLQAGGGDPVARGTGTVEEPGLIPLASVRSFDPQGPSGEENESEVGKAHDGNVQTAWTSDRYKSRPFAGLKAGVGLALHLAEPGAVDRLEVRSSSSGWSASVYVADRPRDRLEEWGSPVAAEQGLDGDASFDLGGKRGGAVLLWITDPGSERRIEIGEVAVS